MPSSQRPFFLSSFLAAFRQQPSTSGLPSAPQSNKHTSPHQQPNASAAPAPSASASRSMSTSTSSNQTSRPPQDSRGNGGSVMNQLPLHSPHHHRGGMPIPGATSPVSGMSGVGSPIGSAGARRRGSDSSSEGFRDVLGAEKWYIGGRTAGGEERFFKLGVVRRVKSGDRLSLDRLSL